MGKWFNLCQASWGNRNHPVTINQFNDPFELMMIWLSQQTNDLIYVGVAGATGGWFNDTCGASLSGGQSIELLQSWLS